MAQVMVRWRDDGAKIWYDEKQQEVSKPLDFLFFGTPGIYRTRQWEIAFTDNLPFSIITIEEEVEVLDS